MSSSAPRLRRLIRQLYDVEVVKFGDFTLKSGIQSPVYFDLRVIVSYPELLEAVADLISDSMRSKAIKCDNVCGVPYTALPFATCLAVKSKLPMLIRRKEAKEYGTKKIVEGNFAQGDNCLIIEDVTTSGLSTLETAQILRQAGLTVTNAIVFLDRMQGATENLNKHGIALHSVCSVQSLLDMLLDERLITVETVARVNKFLKENSTLEVPVKPDISTKKLQFSERARLSSNKVNENLFNIIHDKQTNLAVAVDVTKSDKLLKIANDIGQHICILKTHVDILEDFHPDVVTKLKQLAEKHRFLIMEDRKFSDIGQTVQLQYDAGVYRISDWADIVTVHPLPGPDVVKALKKVGLSKERGCILVAEMSSKGNLANKEYALAATKMALEDTDFVMGFVSQSQQLVDPTFVHMTPGVNLKSSGDSLGQQYCSPEEAISTRGADVIIVGRGVVGAADPIAAAAQYRTAGMAAYNLLL